MDVFNNIVNSFLEGLIAVVDVLLIWVPDSPFRGFIESFDNSFASELFGYVNFFLPISEILAITTAWIGAIVLYYAASIILRWVKAIS